MKTIDNKISYDGHSESPQSPQSPQSSQSPDIHHLGVLSRPHLTKLALTDQAAASQYLLSEVIRRQQTAELRPGIK